MILPGSGRRGVLLFLLCPLFSLLLPEPSRPLSAQSLAVRAEKIYTVSNGVIRNGMILLENGKIARVGAPFDPPAGIPVLETRVVTPGFIDMHTHVGVYSIPNVAENSDGNEATNPITPQVRALDSYNFDDPAIAVGRAGGVTTVISRPGSANVIGGTSVAVKLKYGPPSEVVVREMADLKMGVEGNPVGA